MGRGAENSGHGKEGCGLSRVGSGGGYLTLYTTQTSIGKAQN